MLGHDADFDELWNTAPEPRPPLTEAELARQEGGEFFRATIDEAEFR